jgi:hypothetical protein
LRETHIRRHALWLLISIACGSQPSPPANLALSIDDDATTQVAITAPIALADLVWVPSPVWREVRAEASDGRTITLTSPATTYANAEVRLYLDGNRVALGVFPPITPDMKPEVARLARQPLESLVGITSLRIVTRRRELPGLTVEVDGKPTVLGTDRLRALPVIRVGPKGSEGWSVLEIAARMDPQRTWRSIRAIGEDASIEVDLRASSHYVLKPNQRGDYVLRVWERGNKAPTREIRKLTKIALD